MTHRHQGNLAIGLIFVALITAVVTTFVRAYESVAAAAPADVIVSDGDGHGSGVHIGGGLILTAAHVVENAAGGGSGNIVIESQTGNRQPAEVLWANQSYDLALIKIPDGSGLRSELLHCGGSAPGIALRVGDNVTAVGNPLDQQFVTMFGRIGAGVAERGPWREAFIVDMTTVPGMSGGAVYNSMHELIGITVGMGALPAMGGVILNPFAFGFIVPVDAACVLMGRVT